MIPARKARRAIREPLERRESRDQPGIQGPIGPTGAQGPQGDKGDTGASGPQGTKGDTGTTGAQGPKGDKGDTGAAGPAGAQTVHGSVVFVDALDTTGYSATGGSQNVFATAPEAASPLTVVGTLSGFSAHAGSAVGTGGVTLTVFADGSATTVTCTIPSGSLSCTDSTHTASFSAGDTIEVRIQNPTGAFVRNVAWTAVIG